MSIPPCNILYSHQGHLTKCIKLFALDCGIRKETPADWLCIIIIDVHPCTPCANSEWKLIEWPILDGSLYFWRFSRFSRPENPFKTWVVGKIINIKDKSSFIALQWCISFHQLPMFRHVIFSTKWHIYKGTTHKGIVGKYCLPLGCKVLHDIFSYQLCYQW